MYGGIKRLSCNMIALAVVDNASGMINYELVAMQSDSGVVWVQFKIRQ